MKKLPLRIDLAREKGPRECDGIRPCLAASRKMDFAGLDVGICAAAIGVVYNVERFIHPREEMIEQPQNQCRPAIFNQVRYPVEDALDPLHPAAHLVVFDITVGAGGLGDGLLELRKQRGVVCTGRGSGKLQFLQQQGIALGKAEHHLDEPFDALAAEMLADFGEATGSLLQSF